MVSTKGFIVKAIKNINALCNMLVGKYGVDKAQDILGGEYNCSRTTEWILAAQQEWITHLAKQAGISGPRVDNTQPRREAKPSRMDELNSQLDYLRSKWASLNASIKGVDGRTALAKRTRTMMRNIMEDGISVKQQMPGA